jgi:hypothetical protein
LRCLWLYSFSLPFYNILVKKTKTKHLGGLGTQADLSLNPGFTLH